ncbi:hypothetical protein IMCC3317_45210 [Kordia antarctica]|uniref:Uncharacterized protein n=1 Tax=Kordia antarctica TaxID=1218801 RepID=A0A7L4ZRM0_9FLAO|nr:hypothetical protein [Kordia antarctica]QHI39120.1 hypothetical protein IMCC3317_45210 [Kordia antarctica]
MKKVTIDFEDYLSPEMIKAIATMYKDGFKESDVISFSEVDIEMEDRVKFNLNDIIFLVKKSTIKDVLEGKYEEDFMTPPKTDDVSCEGDYCE